MSIGIQPRKSRQPYYRSSLWPRTSGKHDSRVAAVCSGIGVCTDREEIRDKVFAVVQLRRKHERRLAIQVADVDKVLPEERAGKEEEGEKRGRREAREQWKVRW